MVDNPYKVLGISQGASADEIKKAYRKKAKECHPDLHPNDPHAQEKMNEVNEAYDMLCNPEKYQARAASQSSSSSSSGYSGAYNNGQTSGSYQSGGYGNTYRSTYSGNSGWSTSSFDADDLFSFFFGGGASNVNTAPRREAGDDAEICYIIDAINAKRYQDAVSRLVRIPSNRRNARWFYLSAMANYGIHNQDRAKEHIQRAVELDPNNAVYKSLYRQYASRTTSSYNPWGYAGSGSSGSYGNSGSYSSGQSSYNQNRSGSNFGFFNFGGNSLLRVFGRIILFIMMMRLVRVLFAILFGGFMYLN